ncbi:carbohydrate sulfotransferase 1-like isoform X2 [Ruditapes philippinarum]|uniref:carbohydrate sulfotransferase 1-like isoform X2 n=1 Tax=Ruditapes philippinarum TaxID=129788 RepID=UPI00295ACDC5|nr:carbohydrate sulfotransferase 1-like isoform X2 [Ruditapes philippinarum]
MTKEKWITLILACGTGFICLFNVHLQRTYFMNERKYPEPQKPVVEFWTYWHGNNMTCRSDRLECRKAKPVTAVQYNGFVDNQEGLYISSLDIAKTILQRTYDCQFMNYDQIVVKQSIQGDFGGPSWNTTNECFNHQRNYHTCFQRHIPRTCKNSTHKVTKVLRLTTDNLIHLLLSRANLKVIHLFRDPRAIINSRIQTDWYRVKRYKMVKENAKSLCNKMLYDFREGQKVYKQFPNRFKFIYYEDLSVDILNKSKILYKYLGMNANESYYPQIIKVKSFKNKTSDETERTINNAYWWRGALNWEIVEQMNDICRGVYNELGFKSFYSIHEYNDMSIPSQVIPKEFLIV